MKRLAFLAAIAALSLSLSACQSARTDTQQAYVVNSQGAVSPTTRSALAGSTAPGAQEIVGLYVPFLGTGLALKAGLEYDGNPTVITIPVANAPQAAPQAACAPQYVDEQVTEYVPETRMVPRTRTVRRALVPVPAAAPNPCAPAPQAAPRSCPTPPPEPAQACTGDGPCGVPATQTVATSGR